MSANRIENADSLPKNGAREFPRPAVGLRVVAGLVAILIAPFGQAWGQDDRPTPVVVKGAASFKPVRLADIGKSLTDLPKAPTWKETDPIKETNPRRHHGREGRIRNIPKAAAKVDVLLGFQTRAAAFNVARDFDPPALNIDGQGFTGVNPPDTAGDIGGDYFIQAINGANGAVCTVYKKADGTVAAGPFRLRDLGDVQVTGKGDPIILYDHPANRWVLTEFSESGNKLLVYVSKTSDPVSGGWKLYEFTAPNFPDYPKYGLWNDAYYVTTNEADGPAIYALDRAKMLAGENDATMQRFLASQLNGFGFQALTPADLDGPAPSDGAPGYAMRHRDDEVHNPGSNDPNQDFLELYELRINWSDATQSTFAGPAAIPISEIDSDLNGLLSFSCFPQKGSSTRLDPLREVIMSRLQYRNFGTHESIVGSFVTDVDGTDHGGVRWFELRKADQGSWQVHQEGTYAPDSHHRWMSSIAMDGSGNIALAYNVTSSSMFPSLRYAGRLVSDPMGTMPRGEHTLIDGTVANASQRYGDYAALCVDPSDDRVFWFTGEYNAASTWSTRIGSFRFAAAPSPPTAPAGAVPAAGDVNARVRALEVKVDKLLRQLRGL
jgi:hypothetical protein